MANIFDLFRSIESQNKTEPAAKSVSAIVAGLGNPGAEYAHTRHNMGFLCMDILCDKLHAKTDRVRFHALCGEATVGGNRVLLMRPQTYMNNSGEAIREAASFYKIPAERVFVIYDDMSLEAGTMRIRKKGSAGGHNGIKSIIAQLGTDAFPRIKIGVGAPPAGSDTVNWVLGTVPTSQRAGIAACFENVLPALELMLNGDIDTAMCKFNGKGSV